MPEPSAAPPKSLPVTGLREMQAAGGAVRHCKIVGTLGPASSDEKVLAELIAAGLDIARLNFSHGTHDQHRKNIDLIRRLAREAGRRVALLQDLQGPKIRVGKILGDGVELQAGQSYTL